MIFGSVCSGIEAASVAWHPLGWRCAFVSETAKFPRQVLQYRLGAGTPNGPALRGDFTKIESGDHEPIDLLVGGTPCQSFSVAGQRRGLDDPRGDLAIEFLRLARRLRPRWLVFENVPGLLSTAGGRDFGAFLGLMGDCGYGFAYRVLDAQFVRVDGLRRAVPQRRRRVFVVGYLGDWRCAAAVLFEPEGLRGDPAPSRKARQDVARSVTARAADSVRCPSQEQLIAGTIAFDCKAAGKVGFGISDVPLALRGNGHGGGHAAVAFGGKNTRGSIEVATACRAKGGSGHGDFESETFVAHTLRAEGFDATEDGSGRGTPIVPILEAGARTGKSTDAPRAGMGIGDPGDPMFTLQSGKRHAVAFHENQRGEITLNDTAGSLKVGGGKPGQGYPAVAFDMRGREGGAQFEGPHDTANVRAASGGSSRSYVSESYAVRRLTPRECERLQGLPDDWTRVPWRKKSAEDCPDGPRYQAIGNSMAVNVMRWIGSRIDRVDRSERG